MTGLLLDPRFWTVVLVAACAWLAWRLLSRERAYSRLKTETEELRRRDSDHRVDLDRARRMEAVGILAGGIVNNLNNLLSVVLGNARLIVRDPRRRDEITAELDRIIKAGHMAGNLVQELSDFYRQADRTRKPTDLVPVVRDTLKLLRDILPSSRTIREEISPCGPVLATQAGVQQILMNLASNAAQATGISGGSLTVRLYETVVSEPLRAAPQNLQPGSYAVLEVVDDGHGMDTRTLDDIMENGAAAGDGTGLGLRTVHRIVGEHEGATVFRSRPGEGTQVLVHFPLIAWSVSTPVVAEPPADSEPQGMPAAAPRATVLLVDDEEMVAQVQKAALKRLGYRVVAHSDPRRALADFTATPEVFDVLVTDQIMPHMSGVKLTRRIKELRPDLPCILSTGFRDSFNDGQAREAGVNEFVLKPASHRDLAALIDRVAVKRLEGRG